MATPRKRWFRCPDSVGAEPWSNDVLATLIRLQAHLNTRWARDGKEGAAAGSTVLRSVDLMALTGSGSLARARRIIHACATHVSLMVDAKGMNTSIEWPKFAEFQGMATRELPSPHPPPPPPPHPQPHAEEERASGASPPREKISSNGSSAAAVWPEVQAAFAAYGKPVRALGGARRREIAARLGEASAGDVVAAVHGYIAHHGHPRGDFDPMAHFTPDTVFRASKFAKYVEAHDNAVAQGRSPPFPLPQAPKRASERTLSERVKDIAEGKFL